MNPPIAAMVPTARGDAIPAASLGFTLMHEHTFNLSPEINQNYPETWGSEKDQVGRAIAEYKALKSAGVDTIVDVTVIGLGRFIPRIKQIAQEVQLNIVVATGVYIWQALPMFFTCMGPGTVAGGNETMDDLFVRDIEDGIGNTGVKAGILKVATDKYGLTPDVTRVLRATAVAHRRTGVPITTHTHDAPNGLDQQKVFRKQGVDLGRTVIGHMDVASTHAMDYVEEVIANGSFIGIDQFGVPLISDDQRIDTVVSLVERGYADRIVLSHDHNCYCDMVPSSWLEDMPAWRKTYIIQDIIPALRERGVSASQIAQMTVVNPRRIFETRALGAY